MKRNQRGFGILQALFMIVLVGLVVQTGIMAYRQISNGVLSVKSMVGQSALASYLVPILTEQAFCSSRLVTPVTFHSGNATNPISFKLANPAQPALGSTPTFYPQFNLIVNSIYLKNMVAFGKEQAGSSNSMNTGASGANLYQTKVYHGELAISVSQGTNPLGTTVPMPEQIVTNSIYIWVDNGNKIVNCGIMKTPQQTCVNDLGGTWDPGDSANGANPCASTNFPCCADKSHNCGWYYLGVDTTTGNPICVKSPAMCPLNQTMVSDGMGGVHCAAVP